MNNVKKIPFKSHEEWLELRRFGIGGSDVGAILGLHNYKSPTGVWLEKIKQTEPDEETEAMRCGNLWENLILKTYAEESGNKVTPTCITNEAGEKEGFIFVSKEYEFMVASLDGIGTDADGKNFVFEAKYTNNFDTIKTLKAGETPVYWLAQVAHYLIVTGLDYAIIAYQAGSDHHGTRKIERNKENEKIIIQAEIDFWKKVESGDPPELDGSKEKHQYLFDQYPEQQESIADLKMISDKFQEFMSLKKKVKAIKGQLEILSAEIKTAMGANKYGQTEQYKATWSRGTTKSFDTDRFKKENPDIVKKYTIEKETQRFTIKEVK